MKNWFTLSYLVRKVAARKTQSDVSTLQNIFTLSEDDIRFSPSENSIQNILDFAHSYEVLDSDSTGSIDIIIN